MASDEQLLQWFRAVAAAAATRRTGIILAIDGGSSMDEHDDIEKVAQKIITDAAASPAAAWASGELKGLVPDDKSTDPLDMPYVPTVGEAPEGKESWRVPWCWALRVGYARDRVIAYARVKAAMFEVHNLSSGPEVQAAMFRVLDRASALLRTHDDSLKNGDPDSRPRPEEEIKSQRLQWLRAAAELPNAQRQQPTMIRSPAVTGLTAREVEAIASDPGFDDPNTFAICQATAEIIDARDALMGTETFVSFVFPARDHREMHAVGAADQGVRVEPHGVIEGHHKYPAMVTLHNATGAIENILPKEGVSQASNVFVTNDAATLLKDLHSLIVKARKDPTDPLTPLPFRGQRNYLLLEHSVL